jgi:hypothetical protein
LEGGTYCEGGTDCEGEANILVLDHRAALHTADTTGAGNVEEAPGRGCREEDEGWGG